MTRTALVSVRSALAEVTRTVDPELVTAEAAAEMTLLLAGIEKLAAGARVLLAERASRSTMWREQGHATAADAMAAAVGSTPNRARDEMKLSRRLAAQPHLRDALRHGTLSVDHARIISRAADLDPTTETELVDTARRASMNELRTRCAEIEAAAGDPGERARRQHHNRHLRTWTGPDGSLCGRFSLPPVDGAELLAILEQFERRVFTTARKAGHHDNPDQHAADALIEAFRAAESHRCGATPPGRQRKRRRARINLTIPVELLTGDNPDGKVATIAGVGPVPTNCALAQFDGALVNLLVTKGQDVTTVATNTRYYPTALRVAIEHENPTCCIVGCGRTRHLEKDHIDAYAHTRRTDKANTCVPCSLHHDLKTFHGHQLVQRPDGWHCIPPNQPTPAP